MYKLRATTYNPKLQAKPKFESKQNRQVEVTQTFRSNTNV